MMRIFVEKKRDNAILPTKGTIGSAAYDLYVSKIEHTEDYIEYKSGIGMEIPEGYVGLVFPRSSISKTNLLLKNSVGVIDSDYRGEITGRFKDMRDNPLDPDNSYQVGERFAQIMIIKREEVAFIETDKLSDSKRGTGGYGHTGK